MKMAAVSQNKRSIDKEKKQVKLELTSLVRHNTSIPIDHDSQPQNPQQQRRL
jgi:hypothetical protein